MIPWGLGAFCSAMAAGAAATLIPNTAPPMAVTSSLFARVWVVLTLCFLFLWVVSGISGPNNRVR